MASAQELTGTVATLTERVSNHVTAGKWVTGIAGSWLVGISLMLFHMNGTISDMARLQADSTPRVIGELLAHPSSTSKSEVQDGLKAASVILSRAKIGKQPPDPSIVRSAATRLREDQDDYPDMPEVWKATGDFINYKFAAYLSRDARQEIKGAYSLSCQNVSNLGSGPLFDHCNLDLEGVAANNATFYKCVIRYHGGPIKINRIQFLDCVFDLDVSGVPSGQGGSVLMRQLASAEDTTRVNIST